MNLINSDFAKEYFMEKTGKRSYASALHKNGYALFAFFFAALILAALIAFNEFSLATALVADKRLLAALIAAAVYFFFVIIISSVKSISGKGVSLFDSFYLSCFIAGLLYAVYFCVIAKNPDSIIHWCIAAVLAVVGVVHIIISAIKFDADAETGAFAPQKNSVKNYYKALNAKFPLFLTILLSALIAGCAFLVIFNARSFGADKIMAVVLALCVLPLALYLIFGVSDKNVGFFDAALLALLIALPAVFIFVGFRGFTGKRLTTFIALAAALAVLAAFYTVMRWLSVDLLAAPRRKLNSSCKTRNYFSALSQKFSPLFAISCGSLLVVITLVLFRYTSFPFYFEALKAGKTAGINAFILVAVNALSFALLILGAIISFINIRTKKITIGDFALLACMSYAVFGLISFIKTPSSLGLIILPVVFIFTLTILSARIKNVEYED